MKKAASLPLRRLPTPVTLPIAAPVPQQATMEAGALGAAPREVLACVFGFLPAKDRCQTVTAVCAWWRAVALDCTESLLGELSLVRVPLFTPDSQYDSLPPDFADQQAAFLRWLRHRQHGIRRLALMAQSLQDDAIVDALRLGAAEIVAPQLRALRIVMPTDLGCTASHFLSRAAALHELRLDWLCRTVCVPEAITSCSALSKLSLRASFGMLGCLQLLASLTSLRDLSVCDGCVPCEQLRLPLTRLHLLNCKFALEGWLPRGAEPLAGALRELSLVGCQLRVLPEQLAQLVALTALRLDRNFFTRLPDCLSRLLNLRLLSCECCSGLVALPPALAALPLQSLNLLHTSVARLPMSAGVRLLAAEEACDAGEAAADADAGAAAAAASPYLRHLTELRWGVPEWEPCRGGGGGVRSPLGAGPDFSPLLQAHGLAVVRLAHVPAWAEPQVAALRRRLPSLARLQVNSAVLVGVAP